MHGRDCNHTRQALYLFAIFAVVTGSRLWIVATYGSSLPILDEWGAEGASLFKPWLEGTLSVAQLFAPHNEHRIVPSRLLALTLLSLNGQWDSLLEMVVNALLMGGIAVAISMALLHLFGWSANRLVLPAVALWAALPYAQENTLWGFQSAFYLLIAFSLGGIWGVSMHRPLSIPWLTGAFSLLLGCLSMGSGFLAFLPLIGMATLLLLADRKRWRESATTILVCGYLIGISLHYRTVVPHHASIIASSVGVWVTVFGRCLAWPFCDVPAAALIMYLPVALLAFRYLRLRSEAENQTATQSRIVLGVALWVVVQAAAIAYSRGGSAVLMPVSRYMDILAMGAVANVLALAMLISKLPLSVPIRRVALVAATYWVVAVTIGAVLLSCRELGSRAPRGAMLQPNEEAVRAYVATHDRKYLEGEPPPQIPYPDATVLGGWLDDPLLRSILPAVVREPIHLTQHRDSSSAFVSNGYPPELPNPAYERAWGSYAVGGKPISGVASTATATTRFPYLEFEVAGQLATRMSLNVRADPDGEQNRFKPDPSAGVWRRGIVATPASQFRVVARDENSEHWFAFREPREVGRLSFYAELLARRGALICFCGIALWIALLALERNEPRLNTRSADV